MSSSSTYVSSTLYNSRTWNTPRRQCPAGTSWVSAGVVPQGAGQPAGGLTGALQGLGDHTLTEVAKNEEPNHTDVGHQQDGKKHRRRHQAAAVSKPRSHRRGHRSSGRFHSRCSLSPGLPLPADRIRNCSRALEAVKAEDQGGDGPCVVAFLGNCSGRSAQD